MPKFHPLVPHYNVGSVQVIDFLEANFTASEYRGYLKGQVIKYISRYQHKGNPLADLEKAMIYMGWLIEFEEGQPASELNKF